MQLKLNTNLIPIFEGCYYTKWKLDAEDVEDYQVLKTKENKHDSYGWVDYDFGLFLDNIMTAFEQVSPEIMEIINQAVGCKLVKDLTFTGNYSPSSYNFSTDELDFNLTLDENLFCQQLQGLKNDNDFKQWLREHYMSRDGFMSHTPYRIDDLIETIKNKDSEYEQAVSAVICYLIKDVAKNINWLAFEHWSEQLKYEIEYKVRYD